MVSEGLDGQTFEYIVRELGEENGSITIEEKSFKVSYKGNMKDGFTIVNIYEEP